MQIAQTSALNPSAANVPTKIEVLLDFAANNPVMSWGIAIFAVLAMATAAVAAWTGNLSKIIEFCQKYWPFRQRKITEEQQLRLRQQFILVLQTDVARRLSISLHNLVKIDVEREEQRQRVGQPQFRLVDEDAVPQRPIMNLINRGFQLFTQSKSLEPVESSKRTLELFKRKDINGRLLILGEPGSGKTTELLELAQDLLKQTEKSEQISIPVIFELSTWKSGQAFLDWLCIQLDDNYRIPRQVTQLWIERQQLLPLFDGLDELGLINQVQCIEAINQL